MTSFQVAIPSYQRAEILAEATLPLILSRGVPPEAIRVWTATEAETEAYREACGIFIDPDQITEHGGGVGMRNARNAIPTHYPKGTRLLQLDDDLYQIHKKVEEEQRSCFGHLTEKGMRPVGDLPALIEAGFDLADEEGVSLWGVYPVKNPFYLRFLSRVGNLYCIGAWTAMTLRHDETEVVTLDDKEDMERSIKHYLRDGGVLRLENYSFHTQYYINPGGMQAYRTPATVRAGALDLMVMYPDLTAPKKPTKGNPDMDEVKLHPPHARRTRLIEI